MSDDLIQRFSIDFRRMRTYDDPTGPFVRFYAHAQALTEARAEIERWAVQALKEEDCREMWQTRALAAESELSTLRARVLEVVGPFSRLDTSHTDDIDDSALVFENEGGDIVLGHLRAARQLMEEVK